MQRAQSVPDEELGAYPGMRYGAKAAEGMAETQRYSAVRAEGPGAAEVERRRAEIDAWQQQMQEEARQKAEAERQRIAQQKAYEAEQQRIAQQKAYEVEQQRVAQQKAYEAEQQRVAQQKAYEEAQRQKAQAEYQRQLAEYERQKAQYEQDMARYRQEKAAYDAEMARRAAQSDEAAQSDAQTAPRRRRGFYILFIPCAGTKSPPRISAGRATTFPFLLYCARYSSRHKPLSLILCACSEPT